MISIIICSIKPNLLEAVSENIARTIGVQHEIIAIDNRKGTHGICSAYNHGASQSRFSFLCFVHEDVIFHTQDWGLILKDLLENRNIGLVGLAGAIYKPAMISGWWDVPPALFRKHLVQHTRQGEVVNDFINPKNEPYSEVVSLDGVFLATRKEVWQENSFDEKTFPGFHFYDTDFSTQIANEYKLVVTHQIKAEHLSQGNANSITWLKHVLLYHHKWKHKLPLQAGKFTFLEKLRYEYLACKKIMNRSIMAGFPLRKLLPDVWKRVKFPYQLLFTLLLPLKLINDKSKLQ